MFEPIKAAKLQPADVARLLGLSRVTVSMWLNDHATPHRLHADRVQKLIDGVAAAVEANALPLHDDVARRDRGDLIAKALQPYWTDDLKA